MQYLSRRVDFNVVFTHSNQTLRQTRQHLAMLSGKLNGRQVRNTRYIEEYTE